MKLGQAWAIANPAILDFILDIQRLRVQRAQREDSNHRADKVCANSAQQARLELFLTPQTRRWVVPFIVVQALTVQLPLIRRLPHVLIAPRIDILIRFCLPPVLSAQVQCTLQAHGAHLLQTAPANQAMGQAVVQVPKPHALPVLPENSSQNMAIMIVKIAVQVEFSKCCF